MRPPRRAPPRSGAAQPDQHHGRGHRGDDGCDPHRAPERIGDFVDAVRDGRPDRLNSDVLEGHISTGICHAGNISYRLGRMATKDEIREVTREIPAWDETFDRLLVHLKAHDIDVDSPAIALGPWLEPVPGEERFKDNDEANRLVKGFYREEYMVPEVSAS